MEKLSIRTVSQMAGLTPFTLRAWEKRYGFLTPKRSPNGRRFYTIADVEKLRLLVALKQAGHSLSSLQKLSISELNQLLNSTTVSEVRGKINRSDSSSLGLASLQSLFESIQNLELDQLSAQLKILQLQLSTKDYLLAVVSPLLRHLGKEVSQKKLQIYHEHAVSALLKHILSGLIYATERSTVFRQKHPVLLASPEKDFHEFGALISAILTMLQGYRVFYLGANMPADSLCEAAKALKSPLVIVGCSAPEEALSSEKLKKYLHSLVEGLPRRTPLWIGGSRHTDLRGLNRQLRKEDRFIWSFEELDRILQNSSSLLT